MGGEEKSRRGREEQKGERSRRRGKEQKRGGAELGGRREEGP